MANVTILIEDLPNGKVKIAALPNFELMMKMEESGAGLTPAHGYAMRMLLEARKLSKENDPRNVVKVPRIGRA